MIGLLRDFPTGGTLKIAAGDVQKVPGHIGKHSAVSIADIPRRNIPGPHREKLRRGHGGLIYGLAHKRGHGRLPAHAQLGGHLDSAGYG